MKAQAEKLSGPDVPGVGQVYRHYKGGLYDIVAVGLRDDDLEPTIGYRSRKHGTTWFRTLTNFTEIVVTSGGWNLGRRFVLQEAP